MLVQLDLVLRLIVVILIVAGVLLLLVMWSKVRRDVAERESLARRQRILRAWEDDDVDAMLETCRETAKGDVQDQSDFLSVCSMTALESWWTADRVAHLQRASHLAGLDRQLARQLTSARAVRRGLAAAIGGYPATALDPVRISPLLADPDPTVRLAAAGALERLATPEAADVLIRALLGGLLPDARIIERLGHPWAVPRMLAELSLVDARARLSLLRAIALAEDPIAIPDLELIALASANDEHRAQAMRAIARCVRHAPASTRLEMEQFARRSLDDPHPVIRTVSIDILAQVANVEDLPILIALVADPDWFVRRAAARALTAFGTAGTEALRRVAEGDDPFAAHRAREQLALSGFARPGAA